MYRIKVSSSTLHGNFNQLIFHFPQLTSSKRQEKVRRIHSTLVNEPQSWNSRPEIIRKEIKTFHLSTFWVKIEEDYDVTDTRKKPAVTRRKAIIGRKKLLIDCEILSSLLNSITSTGKFIINGLEARLLKDRIVWIKTSHKFNVIKTIRMTVADLETLVHESM